MDAVSLLETNIASLDKRIDKLREQLEAAEVERAEAATAVRVLAKLGLAPIVESAAVPKISSKAHVFEVMSFDEGQATSPADIHAALIEKGITSITQDNVRTILSRNKELISARDGRYWRSGLDLDNLLGASPRTLVEALTANKLDAAKVAEDDPTHRRVFDA